jgi:uncharacterized protein (TIGR03067 family)
MPFCVFLPKSKHEIRMRSILPCTVVAVCLCGTALGVQEPAKQELAKHQGTWTAVSFRREGQETPAEIVRTITRTVEGDHVVWKRDGKSFAGTTVVLDPGQTPKAIDVLADGGPSRGKRVLEIGRASCRERVSCDV